MHKIAITSLMSLLLSITASSAQSSLTTTSIPRVEGHEFVSKINGRAYTVLVSLPRTYTGNQSARFPIIYLTDANWLFGLTAQSYHLLRLGGMVPDAVIVGIVRSGVEEDTREGSAVGAERAFDLTPTRNVDEERRLLEEYKRDVRTGGGPAFLRVLAEELIPDIESRYRVSEDRTLVGYSLGGLFGAYVLFQSPETFKRMVLVSPSLWWDGGVIAKQEQAYAEKHKALRVHLFMSDGERETDQMVGTMRQLERRLASRRYEGLRLDTRIFESESHLSTFPVAVTRGLTTVFAEPPKP